MQFTLYALGFSFWPFVDGIPFPFLMNFHKIYLVETVILEPALLQVAVALDSRSAVLDLVVEVVAVLDQWGIVKVAVALDLVLEVVPLLDWGPS